MIMMFLLDLEILLSPVIIIFISVVMAVLVLLQKHIYFPFLLALIDAKVLAMTASGFKLVLFSIYRPN